MNVVCLAIDRLHAGYLGCYGNCWISTPAFDRLASESFAFDQAIVDRAALAEVYSSYWHGLHALERREVQTAPRPSLARLLSDAGWRTLLATDEPALVGHALAADFDEAVLLASPADRTDPASGEPGPHDGAGLAAFFAGAHDALANASGPYVAWLHSRGLGAPWDAPLEHRRKYADEEEPMPPDFTAPPCRRLPADYDPDELLGVVQAYAGQITCLDECLASWLAAFDALPAAGDTLLVAMSARGFPLGEHLRLGPVDDRPGGELVQVPWMWRFPDRRGAGVRTPALVQPADVPWTMLDLLGVRNPWPAGEARSLSPLFDDETATVRDRAYVVADGGCAIRTPEWHFCRYAEPPASTAPASAARAGEAPPVGAEPQLYVKPDDRWEFNDVASRCRDVVEELQQACQKCETPEQP